MPVKPDEGVSFQSHVSKNVIVEIEQPSPDEDKIIIEDDSNEENAKCMPATVVTSSIKPPIVSIDSHSDYSVSIGVSKSPPIHQRGKFHEKDIGINLIIVNIVFE